MQFDPDYKPAFTYAELLDTKKRRGYLTLQEQQDFIFYTQEPAHFLDASLYADNYLYSHVSRPTEDRAINNLYKSCKLLSGAYRDELDELEADIFSRYLHYKLIRHYEEMQAIEQTAIDYRMGLQEIKSLLRDIDHIARASAQTDALPFQVTQIIMG